MSIEEGVAGGVGAENDTRIETPYLELVLLPWTPWNHTNATLLCARSDITDYILSTEPRYAKSAVVSGGSRPTTTALRNLEKAAGSADPVRRLAVALLEGTTAIGPVRA